MSSVTPPTEEQQMVVPGDLDLVAGNTGSGTASLYLRESNSNLYANGNTHLKQTLVELSNGDFNVSGTGSNLVNFDIPGSISFRTDTSGIFSTSVGQMTLESLDTTNGKVLVSSAGQGTDAVLIESLDTTDGQIRLSSAGQGASIPSLKLEATGTTGGGIDIESATASSTVRAININATDTTNGSVQITGQGDFSSSIPAINLQAPNGTSGKILVSSGSNSTTVDAIELNASSATGGAININSQGPGTSDGSIHINAANATSGSVKITGNGTSATALNVATPNGGQTFNAGGEVTIQTTDTTDGIKIATDTANVPVTIGTAGSTTTVAGNFITNGAWTELRPTNTIVFDNIITVNTNPSVAGDSDAGLAMKRQQQPNDTGVGDVVNRPIPRIAGSFQIGSATPATLVLDSATSNAPDNFYTGWSIKITSGAGANQVRKIKSFVAATQTATLYETADNTTEPTFTDGLDLTTAPAAADTYELYNGNFSTVIYNETDDSVQHREAVIEPGAIGIIAGQFTKTKIGETTIQPLSYQYAEISSSGTLVTVTLNSHDMSNGDKVRISNPVTATGTINAGVYEVSNVTANTFDFVNSTSVTTNGNSVVDVSLLETSVLAVNKIIPQDTGYGSVSIGGLANSQVVSLDKGNSSAFATINVEDQVQGSWFVSVYNQSNSDGAGANFSVTKRSGDNGNINRITQEAGADNHRIRLRWQDGQTLRLENRRTTSGVDNFFVRWS